MTVEHPTAGAALQSAAPFEFSAAGVDYSQPAPALGEHTDEILLELLGMGPEETRALREAGVVG